MSTGSILMIKPAGFCSNPETSADNAFQSGVLNDNEDIRQSAEKEFNHVKTRLSEAGIRLTIFQPPDDSTPDALFPNNWFSTHEDGTIVFYPMKASNRRKERRKEFVQELTTRYAHTIDLTPFEQEEQFLEGTGSLVLDRKHKIAYAALSERTNPMLAKHWAGRLDYQLQLFHTQDPNGRPYYHTNVVLSIGEQWAVCCPDSFAQEDEREQTIRLLKSSGKTLITLSPAQLAAYCANILEVHGADGTKFLVVSSTAWSAFSDLQRMQLTTFCQPLVVDIPVIEQTGGGGVRCMLAELY